MRGGRRRGPPKRAVRDIFSPGAKKELKKPTPHKPVRVRDEKGRFIAEAPKIPKIEVEKPSWDEIHETAKTFLEGLGEDAVHDLVSLARIEKDHTAGILRTTKATKMVKNICSFFDNNPFKSRNKRQFEEEMNEVLELVGNSIKEMIVDQCRVEVKRIRCPIDKSKSVYKG